MSSDIRHRHLREKYELDQAHIRYLLDHGWQPLEIADAMTDYMIAALREGVRQRHPEWDEHQILEEMRNIITHDKEMQKKRGLRQNGRN